MKKMFFVIMVLSLLVLAGCSVSNTEQAASQEVPVITGDHTVDSAAAPLVQDTNDIEIGEML